MHTKLLPALTLGLFSTGLAAQYLGEPATEVVPYGASKLTVAAINASNPGLNATRIVQVQAEDSPLLPADTWYMVMTAGRSSGGAGGDDIISGHYNHVTGTFTKNADVDALMTAAGEFAGAVSHDLQLFVFEDSAGAKLATRTGISGAFTGLKPITGSGFPGGYVDINLGRMGGKEVVFFIDGANLSAMDLDRTTGAVTNKRTVITNPPTGTQSHSPSPINDITGESRAMIFSLQVAASRSDSYLVSSLDDSTPKFLQKAVAAWINNGSVVGGSVIWADSGTGYVGCQEAGLFGVSSTTVDATTGGTANFTMFAPVRKVGSPPMLGATWIGVLASSGLSIPGVGGKLSIDLTLPIIALPGTPILATAGIGATNVAIPPSSPKIKLSHNAILLDPVAGKLYISNTGTVELK